MEMEHIIFEAPGKSQWNTSTGTKFFHTAMFYMLMFNIAEMIIYVILFTHIYSHNKDLCKKGNSLGLSKHTLKIRKRQNVLTLGGQFASFVVVSIMNIIIQIVYVFQISSVATTPPLSTIIFSAAITMLFFIASPELQRFYFRK